MMLFIATLFLFNVLLYANAQQTGVDCSANIQPQNIDTDPSLYWGTWYTIGTCQACTNASNVCTQLSYTANDASNPSSQLTYTGSYQINEPYGTVTQAFGYMKPVDLTTFNPPYNLTLEFSFGDINANFWILASAGYNGEITAIVTYSCSIPGNTDAQIFFLSRYPYLADPVTFSNLEQQAIAAIGQSNYDQFKIVQVSQQQNWCNYQLPNSIASSTDSSDDDNVKINNDISIAVLVIAVLLLIATVAILKHVCTAKPVAPPVSSTNSNPMIDNNM